MSHIGNIKVLAGSDLRSYVKDNMGEDFLSEVLGAKDVAVPLLVKNKAIPEMLVQKLSQAREDLECLLSNFIEFGYTPNVTFIENLADYDEVMLARALKAFPTVPVSIQFVMKLINQGMVELATFLVKEKKEFQRDEIIIQLFKCGANDAALWDLSKDQDVVIRSLIPELESHSPAIVDRLLIEIQSSADQTLREGLDISSEVMALPLSVRGYEAAINLYLGSNARHSWQRNDHLAVNWSPDLDKIEDLHPRVDVVGAPVGSKNRERSIIHDWSIANDKEILSAAKNGLRSKSWAREVISRAPSLIKQLDLDQVLELLTPSEVAAHAKQNLSTALYLLAEAPSRYKQAVKKVVSKNDLPEEFVARKKTYFPEAFAALKSGNIDAFRDALSGTYNLARFVQDTRQSSKSRSCEMVCIESEAIQKLTKDELLDLCDTPFGMSRTYNRSEEGPLPYKISLQEALTLLEKLELLTVFDSLEDKEEFILKSKIDEGDMATLFSSRKEVILGNKKLFKAFLKASKGKKSELDEDSISAIAKVLDRDEVLGLVPDLENCYFIEKLVRIKCADGKYLLTEQQVTKLLSSASVLEDETLLFGIMERNKDLALKIVKAYLEGNKGLSEFLGHKVNIRRSCVDRFKAVADIMERGPSVVVDEIFSRGGELSEFKKNLISWTEMLNSYGNGRTVRVAAMGDRDLSTLKGLTGVNVLIGVLEVDAYCGKIEEEVNIDRVTVEKVIYKDGNSWMKDERDFATLRSNLKKLGVKSIALREDESINTVIELLGASVPLEGADSRIEAAIANIFDEIENLEFDSLKYLESRGLVMERRLVEAILENSISKKAGAMAWLKERVGDLQDYVIDEDEIKYLEEEEVEEFSRSGVKMLEHSEYELHSIKKQLAMGGVNFEDIDVSSFSNKQKAALIKFIETNVDPSFIKLNLASINLDAVETISSFAQMKALYSMEDGDVISMLCVPKNIATNKKIMKGLRDLLTLNGGQTASRVESLKGAISIIDSKIELTLSDFIDFSDPNEVRESDSFKAINVSTLMKLLEYLILVEDRNIILRGRDKATILRFLRSASEMEESYIQDVIEMINATTQGLAAFETRIETLKAEALEPEAIERLTESTISIKSRLEEVSAMDDIVHMHDRLVPLVSFIKADPMQPLNQDRFLRLEKDKSVSKKLGQAIYFPKTRGDLQYLGDENGWCVNSSRSYGDGVLNKGNILVGICEDGKVASRENVIALAHFIRDGKDKYYLEQLKWSSRKKSGSRNVDGTRDFNHGAILNLITDYLEKSASIRKAE
jgi:hypothetical protein